MAVETAIKVPDIGGATDVDVIDVGADLRLEGRKTLGLTEAADVVHIGRCLADVVHRDHVWDSARHVQGRSDLLSLKGLGRETRNREWHVLQVLAAALCGNDDRIQRAAVGRIRECGTRRQGNQNGKTQFRHLRLETHVRPPPGLCVYVSWQCASGGTPSMRNSRNLSDLSVYNTSRRASEKTGSTPAVTSLISVEFG